MRQQGGMIGHEAYDDPDAGIGGIEGALRQHAERVYSHLDEAHKPRAQRLFRRLVARGPGLNDVRRIVQRGEVEEDWNDLIMELAKHRLVTTSEPVPAQATVEIIHEELLRAWPALRQWIAENREFDLWRQGLTEQADRWQAAPETEKLDFLLRGTQLDKALMYLRERDQDLTPNERSFIQVSVALREQQREREERARRWKIQLAMGIAVVFLVLFGIAGFQWWRAERHREFAEQEAAVARHQTALATSRGLAAEAQNYLNKQLDLALLLSVEANRKAKTAEARQALYTTLDAAGSSIFLHGYWDKLRELAFSPDGKALASGGTVGTLLLWDLSVTPPSSTPLAGHRGDVRALAFSPDGQTLVSGDENGTLLLWNLNESPPASEALPGHRGALEALAFSADGQRLASGDAHGTAFIWDLGGISPRSTPLPSNHAGVQAFRFSPEGKTLAAVDYRGTFLAWDLSSTLPSSISLPNSWGDVRTFTFNPSGRSLALGSATGTLLLWDLSRTPPAKEDLPGHRDNVRALALSSNDKILASGDQSSTLLLWDLSRPSPHSTALSGHQDDIWRLALSPDGRILASGDGRGMLLLWDLSGTKPRPISLSGHQGGIERLAFSPSG
jgi:WD domain, G-beta repeat